MMRTTANRAAQARAAMAALCALNLSTAFAQLGATLGATGSTPTMNGAVLAQTTTDAGQTTIHRYAASDGRIFAVTWQGPTMPDLHALLGAYFADYQMQATRDAAHTAGVDLHASRVAHPDVVVEAGGMMRGYVGRAWLPQALPAGVSIGDLQ